MKPFHSWIFTVFSLPFTCLAQLADKNQPFFANQNPNPGLINQMQFADYKGNSEGGTKTSAISGDEARGILEPIMSPFMDMYDSVMQNYKARMYAEKVQKQREDSPLSSSKSLFDLIEILQQPSTTTTPPPPLFERILKPYIEPWQRQMDDLAQGVAGITLIPTTTTTAAPTTTQPTAQMSVLERSLGMFFPSFRRPRTQTSTMATPTTPPLFDPDYLERLLFTRQKRQSYFHNIQKRQLLKPLQIPPPPPMFHEWEKPLLAAFNPMKAPALFNLDANLEKKDLFGRKKRQILPIFSNSIATSPAPPITFEPFKDPFTPNPLMQLFTTKTPIKLELPENGAKAKPIHDPKALPWWRPDYKIQDPFYNPLFPKRKSKFFDLLAGGEATRLLG